ncbi:MAG: YfcE family phosphodiesterase [Campylobacter sp.]|nr:YfcE family phosphodiesterase [Campylobacter sp.]
MKIAIISDSHHKISVAKSALDFSKFLGVDLIIHAGDIVEKQTLKDLASLGIPYTAIIGNNDYHLRNLESEFNLFEEPYKFEFGGLKFKLMHHPSFLKNDADIIIFGHTHQFCAFIKDSSLYINPGEICARKKPQNEFCILEIPAQNLSNLTLERVISANGGVSWELLKTDIAKLGE